MSPIRRNTFWTQDGDLIQPSGIFELDDGDFFKVVHLDYHEISSRSRVPTAWGWRFRKTSKTLGLPTENPNDVYLILYKNNFDGLEKISVPQILHQTKISFASPVTSEHSNQEQWDSAHDSDTSDNLICRWIHVFATKSAFLGKMKSGKKTNPPKDAFEPSASHIEYFKFIPWGSEDADIAITKLEASDEFESMAQIYAPNAIPHLKSASERAEQIPNCVKQWKSCLWQTAKFIMKRRAVLWKISPLAMSVRYTKSWMSFVDVVLCPKRPKKQASR